MLFNDFSLKQHVNSPTYYRGHILDLVISKRSSKLVKDTSVIERISDHKAVVIELNVLKQQRNDIKKTFHQYKWLDVEQFQHDILCSQFYMSPSSDVDEFSGQYHHEISRLVSIHAPITTRSVTSRPPAPWYTSEIALARRKKRQLERRWKRTKLVVDREIFVA